MAKNSPEVAEPKNGAPRNLTYENMLAHVLRQRDAALAGISAHEAVEVSVPKLDAKGAPAKEDGYLVLMKRAVLKRDLVSLEWDNKIAHLEKLAAGA